MEQARELILNAPEPEAALPPRQRRAPRAPAPDILQQLALYRPPADTQTPAEAAAPASAEAIAERDRRIGAILRQVMADPDAPFRPAAVLYQDFLVRCRIQEIAGRPPELPAFRRMLATTLAGIDEATMDGTDWPLAIRTCRDPAGGCAGRLSAARPRGAGRRAMPVGFDHCARLWQPLAGPGAAPAGLARGAWRHRDAGGTSGIARGRPGRAGVGDGARGPERGLRRRPRRAEPHPAGARGAREPATRSGQPRHALSSSWASPAGRVAAHGAPPPILVSRAAALWRGGPERRTTRRAGRRS